MTTQADKVKEEFAKRLHQGMDSEGYPIRGRARILSRQFSISDKGASKWLNGDAIPETSKIPLIAEFLKINSEWLLSGTGEMLIDNNKNLITKEPLRSLKPSYNLKELENFITELEILDKKRV